MKEQDANLTGLGHCIFANTFVAPPEPKSVINPVSNELPMDELEQPSAAVNADINTLPLAVLPQTETIILPSTTSVLLVIDLPSTENPIPAVQQETLHFVSLENSSNIVAQIQALQTDEKVANEEAVEEAPSFPTESTSLDNPPSYPSAKDASAVIPESNELVTEPLPSLFYVPESASNLTNSLQPLPFEPPPPEPIIAEDII